MKVLIIYSKAKSGKDTFVELFSKHYSSLCFNWSTIGIVKDIAKNHFDWDSEKMKLQYYSYRKVSNKEKSILKINDKGN